MSPSLNAPLNSRYVSQKMNIIQVIKSETRQEKDMTSYSKKKKALFELNPLKIIIQEQ